MDTSFFSINDSLSNINAGELVFDYTKVSVVNFPKKYPIVMLIDGDSVKFLFVPDPSSMTMTEINGLLQKPENIILELPFVKKASIDLTDVIRTSYLKEFPQADNQSYSLLIEGLKGNDVHMGLQGRQEKTSYSTLWLMDLSDKDGTIDLYKTENKKKKIFGFLKTKNKKTDGKDKDNSIIKFLRKLILDFMFDLKHSDVFRVSKDFDRMYTGLMSNFFFSALMHKCEFYYYSTLLESAIDKNENIQYFNGCSGNEQKGCIIIRKLVYWKKWLVHHVKVLGAEMKAVMDDVRPKVINDYLRSNIKELFDAQTRWVNDIMNPMSESLFEHKLPNTGRSSIYFEQLNADRWPSWFATPEEEMRRVHFTMKEWDRHHNCNARTLTEYLRLEAEQEETKDKTIISMLEAERENRIRVSQWFLDRFDFNDVVHMHVFRHLNLTLFVVTAFFLFVLFFDYRFGIDIAKGAFEFVMNDGLSIYPFLAVLFIIVLILVGRIGTHLSKINNRVYAKHLIMQFFLFDWLLLVNVKILQYYNLRETWTNIIHIGDWSIKDWTFLLLTLGVLSYLVIGILGRLGRMRVPSVHFIKNSHLFLPKLVASITAAWLTLTTGVDVFVSFFDRRSSWLLAIALTAVVFMFILSKINHLTPKSESRLRVFRALEFLMISYCISLVIGLFVMSFVAERYLSRQEYIQEFYRTYVETTKSDNPFDVSELKARVVSHEDTIRNVGKVEFLKYVKFKNDDSYYLGRLAIRYHIPNSRHHLFILPRFLVMFSFLAMFIGVFLQMVFFDQKQMTDFCPPS